MMGIKGDYADIVMDLTEKAVPGIMTSQYWDQEDQPAPGTTAAASPSKSRVNNAGTVGVFDDGSFGPVLPNINLYSPVFNNTGDIDRIAEQTRQLQSVAAASGGRY
jgi:hypothetical protein